MADDPSHEAPGAGGVGDIAEPLDPHQPPVELYLDAHGWHLAVELPGVPASAVTVTWHEGVLRVDARRALPHAPERSVQACEGRYGRLLRRFAVPPEYDPLRAEAALEQGLLRVRVPAASARPKLRLVSEAKGAREG